MTLHYFVIRLQVIYIYI